MRGAGVIADAIRLIQVLITAKYTIKFFHRCQSTGRLIASDSLDHARVTDEDGVERSPVLSPLKIDFTLSRRRKLLS
jgi:hypothetical protein